MAFDYGGDEFYTLKASQSTGLRKSNSTQPVNFRISTCHCHSSMMGLLTAKPSAGSTHRAAKCGNVPDTGAWAVISPMEHRELFKE